MQMKINNSVLAAIIFLANRWLSISSILLLTSYNSSNCKALRIPKITPLPSKSTAKIWSGPFAFECDTNCRPPELLNSYVAIKIQSAFSSS